MKKIVVSVLLISSFSLAQALDYKPLVGVVQEYGYNDEQPRSFVTFVQDPAGNNYVVKQYRYQIWSAIMGTSICELVALDMGHAIGASLNKACLIPAGVPFVGKDTQAPASLHTFVSGVQFREYLELNTGRYTGLDLKQKGKEAEPVGLSRELIYHMSRHKDFPKMVALDTYVSNMGRLTHNFFYDEATDTFCGIDMASSFYKDLCGPSIENLTRMLSDSGTSFTQEEGKALTMYYRTFKKLIKLYPSELLCNLIDEYAKRAGYYDASFFDKDVQESCLNLLEKRKKTIRKSCNRAPELVKVLKQLLKKHNLFTARPE